MKTFFQLMGRMITSAVLCGLQLCEVGGAMTATAMRDEVLQGMRDEIDQTMYADSIVLNYSKK